MRLLVLANWRRRMLQVNGSATNFRDQWLDHFQIDTVLPEDKARKACTKFNQKGLQISCLLEHDVAVKKTWAAKVMRQVLLEQLHP